MDGFGRRRRRRRRMVSGPLLLGLALAVLLGAAIPPAFDWLDSVAASFAHRESQRPLWYGPEVLAALDQLSRTYAALMEQNRILAASALGTGPEEAAVPPRRFEVPRPVPAQEDLRRFLDRPAPTDAFFPRRLSR